MIRPETYPTDCPGKEPGRDEFSALLSAISDILGEMADSEAEAAYRIPCAPCGPLTEGLADLLNRLRLGLAVHNSRYFSDEAIAAPRSFAGSANPVNSDPADLRAALDDIVELALSSDWPSITWKEIELRFDSFARRVADHVAVSADIRR